VAVGDRDGDTADLAARVNQLAFDAGVVLIELAPRRRSLEDRYLELVQQDPVKELVTGDHR